MALAQLGTYIDNNVDYRLLFAGVVLALLYPSNMSRILGHAKISLWHSKNSLKLTTKDGKNISLADFCKSVIPPCRLSPFLFNGHLQTIWTTLDKTPLSVYYKRWIFENDDPVYTGSYTIDFVVKPYEGNDPSLFPRTTHYTNEEFENIGSLDSRPMLVTLHGLSGGSHELYLRYVLAGLVTEDSGWEACVINSRGCAGSKITSSMLYNARATWDIRHAVKWLRKTFPNRPLFGCGFSLGANIITNYIGEEGANCQLKAACVLSNPWNLEVGSIGLQSTWIGLNIYSKALGTSLKKLAKRHINQISQNPKIDVDALMKLKYLHEFDREVQCPTFGYPTEDAYYRDASSTDSLLGVRIPFLAINAQDDPIALNQALPYKEVQQTPYAVMCATSLGGHLSWIELGGGRWFARTTVAFLQKIAREIDLDKHVRIDDSKTNGEISLPHDTPVRPKYDPMRRRMYTPGS